MTRPPEPHLADTAVLVPIGTKPWTAVAPSGLHVQADIAADTHQGLVRTSNEDHYLVTRFGRFLEPLLTNIPAERSTGLFTEQGFGMCVADGMGGASAGEVASELAIQTLLQLVFATPDWIISSNPQEMDRVIQRMADRMLRIDTELVRQAEKDPHLQGMGTTMTMACNVGARMIVVHVGDSRAYLCRDGRLHRLTRDHTVAQEMLDTGVIRRLEDVPARLQHALTRVLGGAEGFAAADFDQLELADQDKILLCSDGLTGMVDDPDIAAILDRASSSTDACKQLVAAALRAGGKDNVTVIVARYRFSD